MNEDFSIVQQEKTVHCSLCSDPSVEDLLHYVYIATVHNWQQSTKNVLLNNAVAP